MAEGAQEIPTKRYDDPSIFFEPVISFTDESMVVEGFGDIVIERIESITTLTFDSYFFYHSIIGYRANNSELVEIEINIHFKEMYELCFRLYQTGEFEEKEPYKLVRSPSGYEAEFSEENECG